MPATARSFPLTQPQTRPAIILLSLFTLRFIGTWIQVLRQLTSKEADLETWLIVIAVTAIGAEKFTRGGGLARELNDLSVPMPEGALSKCNLSSVSAATGLNREMVRRKVNWLIAAGILEKESNGAIRASAAITQRPEVRKLVSEQIQAVRRLNAHLAVVDGGSEAPA